MNMTTMLRLALVCASIIFTSFICPSNANAQSDIFGKKTEPKSPIEDATNSAMPKLLSGERKMSGESAASESEDELSSRHESEPTFLRNTSETAGFSAMQGGGFGLGAGYGVGSLTRFGFMMNDRIYIGFAASLNIGSIIINPTATQATNSALNNFRIQTGGFELGYQFPFRLGRLAFYNRSYISLGLGFVNFGAFNGNPDEQGQFNRLAVAPPAGLNMFGAAGNLTYYTARQLLFLRNVTLGVDARLMALNNANSFGLYFVAGFRVF